MIFQTQCSSCHDVHIEKTGPALASVTKKRTREWLTRFIKNSQSVIISGDPYALFLYDQFNQQVMPSFSKLSVMDIEAVLAYIEEESMQHEAVAEIELDAKVIQGDDAPLKGREIFMAQCATCHYIHHEGDYGPALASVTKRLPANWLIPFIHNSQQLIESGDPYAKALFSAYDKKEMVPMPFLTEEEIIEVLTYIEYASSTGMYRKPSGISTNSVDAFIVSMPSSQQLKEHKLSTGKIFIISALCVAMTIIVYISFKLFGYLKRRDQFI